MPPAVNIGCKYARSVINLLAFADDMVILAPFWFALQTLLIAVDVEANITSVIPRKLFASL